MSRFGRLFPKKTAEEIDRDPAYRRVMRELKPLRDAIEAAGERDHQERMAEILRNQAERPIGIKPGKRFTPAGRDALEKERGE